MTEGCDDCLRPAGLVSGDPPHEMVLGYGGFAYPAEGLGPGRRLVLWTRGCTRGCSGCVSPELQEPGGYTAVEDIAEGIAAPLRRLGALTVSGGEPFEQPKALVVLLDLLRCSCDFDTVVYTGYLLEELRAASKIDPAIGALLERTDLLIDGPYDEMAPNELQWRGSDNQGAHALSERARAWGIDLDAPMPQRRPLAVQALPSGGFRIVGIPRRGELQRPRRVVRGGLA